MSRLLIVLVLVLAGTLGLSVYLRWFHTADSADGKPNVALAVDAARV